MHSGNYTYHFAAEIETPVLKSNAAATDTDILLLLVLYTIPSMCTIYYSKYVYI